MDLRHGPDSIWALARDAIFPPSAFDAGPLQVAAILGLAGVTDDVDILDMPCGPGRHALPLARVGHRVVGVDATPSYLDEIRPRIDEDMRLELVEADMRTFARDDAFDLALNLYHSFGYFEDEADDRRVLANLRRSLRPGGTLAAAGVHVEPTLAVSPGEAYDKNLTYRAGRSPARSLLEPALELAARSGVDRIVSHRLPLEEAAHGYHIFDGRLDGATKVLLEP